jgi:tetratricopeptide (TPR) repeat protein
MILEAEYDNIRSVLTRAITNENDIAAGLRLSGSLSRFWFNHGYINEALHWTELALAKDDRSDPAASARCLMAAGFFFGQIPGSKDDAQKRRLYFEQSIKLWRELGDRRNLGVTLIGFAFLLNRLGEYEAAIEAAEESLDSFRGTEFHFNAARAANNLALTLLDIGEFERAKPVLDEALIDSRKSDDVFLEAVCLHNMGDLALQTGELENAADLLDQSLHLFEELGQRPLVARTTLIKGEVAAERRDFEAALKLQTEAVLELKEIGDNQGVASAFEALATTFALQGKLFERAAKFQGAAESLRNKIGIGLSPARKGRFESLMKEIETSTGKDAYREAVAVGREMSVARAIDLLSDDGQ